MERIRRQIGTPLITELSICGDFLLSSLASQAPAHIPALFAGAPVLVAMRIDAHQTGRLVLKGRSAFDQPWSETVELRYMPRGIAARAFWARAHIRDLEDAYARQPTINQERRIIAASLDNHVLSRFTAFFAVDTQQRVASDGNFHTVTQAVELPSGWSALPNGPAPASGVGPLPHAPAFYRRRRRHRATSHGVEECRSLAPWPCERSPANRRAGVAHRTQVTAGIKPIEQFDEASMRLRSFCH